MWNCMGWQRFFTLIVPDNSRPGRLNAKPSLMVTSFTVVMDIVTCLKYSHRHVNKELRRTLDDRKEAPAISHMITGDVHELPVSSILMKVMTSSM